MIKTSNFQVILLTIVIILACLWFAGRLLDWEAERVVDQLYPRDQQGIIQGLEPFAIIGKNHTTALVLIHGFMASPATFTDIAHDIAPQIDADIYAPLLPSHARDLQTAAQLDNNVVKNYIQQYLAELSKKYPQLIVAGFSYGGAMVANLAYNNNLPANAHVILISPAVFIRSNDFIGSFKAHIYPLWRNYCNYPVMGCKFPSYEDGDPTARSKLAEEKTLRYYVASSVLQLYKFDSQNREAIKNIRQPYSVIMATDDNRTDYSQEKAACLSNKQYCTFYSIPSGSHMFFWGANKQAFENLLLKIVHQSLK